jgi:hypothetical protein
MDALEQFLDHMERELTRIDEVISAGLRTFIGGKDTTVETTAMWKEWRANTEALLRHHGRLNNADQTTRREASR